MSKETHTVKMGSTSPDVIPDHLLPPDKKIESSAEAPVEAPPATLVAYKINFEKIGEAGAAFLAAKEALNDVETLLKTQGTNMDECWRGEDAAAAQKILQRLHANAGHFAAKSGSVGRALESAGAAKPTDTETTHQYLVQMDQGLRIAWVYVPVTLEKDLPDLTPPPGYDGHTGPGIAPVNSSPQAPSVTPTNPGSDAPAHLPDESTGMDVPVNSDTPGTGTDTPGINESPHAPDGNGTSLSSAAPVSGGLVGAQPYGPTGVPAMGGAPGGVPGVAPGTPGVFGAPGLIGGAAGGANAAATSANAASMAAGRGGMPMMPIGGRGNDREGREDTRGTWLAEDMDVWNAESSPAPNVVQ